MIKKKDILELEIKEVGFPNRGRATFEDKDIKFNGRDYLIEEILGLKFKISPFSLFQTNTFGAERLYNIAREFAGHVDDKIIFDLYSGAGTIAQIMAPVAKKVIAIKIVEEAVKMVRDLRVFIEKGYKVEKAKLMDMFPRTPHVEAIVKVEKL